VAIGPATGLWSCHSRAVVTAALGLSALLGSAPAFGWGAEGHRITGWVAESQLSPRTLAALHDLVGDTQLAELALEADARRVELGDQYPGSQRWHYDDRLVCHPDLPLADYCPADNCASRAISRLDAVLRKATSTRAEKRDAVMFLVHIIGDIHQPLHASDNNDRGGNQSRARLPGENKDRSLHSLWDIDLVRRAARGYSPGNYARELVSRYQSRLTLWRQGSPADWLAESYAIGQRLAYGALPGMTCDAPLPASVTLPDRYLSEADRVVPEQLAKAGIRIAAELNSTLGQ
jgi:S1/P1 Nuclease